MEVLGIEVADALTAQWARWFAPSEQPFLVRGDLATQVPDHIDGRDLPDELLDTFELYGTSGRFDLAWFDEPSFLALDRPLRASLVRAQVDHGRSVVPAVRRWRRELGERASEQADGHRFVWWPSLLAGLERRVLATFVTNGRPPSRHREVPAATWAAVDELLPGARRLAGSFPSASGPNCFAAVMAAAGVDGAEHVCMQREPFEAWLGAHTRRGGADGDIGTVLVWRTADGLVDHAAVTIGDGWAFHKPSVGWMSPFMVLRCDDLKRVSRHVGLRLHRTSMLE